MFYVLHFYGWLNQLSDYSPMVDKMYKCVKVYEPTRKSISNIAPYPIRAQINNSIRSLVSANGFEMSPIDEFFNFKIECSNNLFQNRTFHFDLLHWLETCIRFNLICFFRQFPLNTILNRSCQCPCCRMNWNEEKRINKKFKSKKILEQKFYHGKSDYIHITFLTTEKNLHFLWFW